MAMCCITNVVEELAAPIFRVEVCQERWGARGQSRPTVVELSVSFTL